MTSMNNKPYSFLRRTALLGCVLASFFAARLGAVTISSSFTLPTSDFLNLPKTEQNPTLGSFNFSTDPNWGIVQSLGLVNISLQFFGLDTNALNSPDPGTAQGLDYNNINLTLGGFDTGIKLNGFANGLQTIAFNGYTTTNATSIVSALNSNNGVLSVGLLDTNGNASGTNPFALLGGSVSLSFVGATVTPIPFTPAETLGYGLIAALVAFRLFRRREFAGLNLAWARIAR